MMNIYLQELSKAYADKIIMLIMDQAGWHKSKELFIPPNIKLLFLPPYSPELNPVERLWKWIRAEVTHNMVFDSILEIMDAIQTVFKKLTKQKIYTLCHCSYL